VLQPKISDGRLASRDGAVIIDNDETAW